MKGIMRGIMTDEQYEALMKEEKAFQHAMELQAEQAAEQEYQEYCEYRRRQAAKAALLEEWNEKGTEDKYY